MASVVPRLPLLLNADTEAQLRPVVDYLRLLGVNDAGIQQLVTRCPSALLLSVKDDLEPRMELLRSAAGLTHAELAQLLNDNVSVAACSAAALTARIDFLRSRCGLSGRHLTTALLRCSELFSVSLANMERKWAFLSAAVGAAAAAASLATYPRYLTHSLIHQIGPRLRFAERHGVVGAFVAASAEAPLNAVADGDCCEATTTAVVSSGTTASGGTVLELRRLLDCSDAEFVERLMPHLPPGTAAAAAVAAGGDDGGDTHPEMTAELLLQSYSLFAAQWEGEEGLLWAGTNAPFA